jgi:hypothetical protein
MSANILKFAAPGGFGAGAFNKARQAGYTDLQIKQALSGSNLKIGQRVNYALNPQQYGNEMAQRGAAQGGFTDAGSGASYGQRAVMLPDDLKHIGGGLGTVWASGPMTDEQIINMYRGGSRNSWVLPASTSAPGMSYKAPTGTPFIDASASQSDQMRMASGSYYNQVPQAAATSQTPTQPITNTATSANSMKKKKSGSKTSMATGLNIGLA